MRGFPVARVSEGLSHCRRRARLQPLLDERPRHRARDGDHVVTAVVMPPRNPDVAAEKECAEEMEAVVEAGDRRLCVFELKVELAQVLARDGQTAGGVVAVAGEDEEVVGVADQLQSRFLEREVEVG